MHQPFFQIPRPVVSGFYVGTRASMLTDTPVFGNINLPPPPLWQDVWRLGTATRIHPTNGNVQMNRPLIEFLAGQKEAVIQPLFQLLATSNNVYQIVEGLFLAQRLAELNTSGVKTLYAAAARFNNTSNPLIQIYLAGFYRKLNVPESFGPMLEMFIRNAQQPTHSRYPYGNPNEEIGGTLLQQIASFSATETLRRLGVLNRGM